MTRLIIAAAILMLAAAEDAFAQASASFLLERGVISAGGSGPGAPASASFTAMSIAGQASGALNSENRDYRMSSGAICLFCRRASTTKYGIVPSPVQSELAQNYPNPFNPRTMIAYHLADAGEATLRILDMHGRTVAIAARGAHEAGRHTVVFDAGQLPGGAYVFELQTREGSLRRLMTLIK